MRHEGPRSHLEVRATESEVGEDLAHDVEPRVGATEVVFSVDNVHEAYQDLRQRDIEFTQPPRQVTEKLWAANFSDPDGHHLAIFGAPGPRPS